MKILLMAILFIWVMVISVFEIKRNKLKGVLLVIFITAMAALANVKEIAGTSGQTIGLIIALGLLIYLIGADIFRKIVQKK